MELNRRSFISSMLASCVAPVFLPGEGRIWRPIKTDEGVTLIRGHSWIICDIEWLKPVKIFADMPPLEANEVRPPWFLEAELQIAEWGSGVWQC